MSTVTAGVAVAQTTPGQDSPNGSSRTQQETVWKKTPCNLCGVGCGLMVAVQGGRAVAVKGDPDSSVGNGLACAKGYYSVQSLYAKDRLTRATIRRSGTRTQVPIGQALDLVAQRLRETIEKYGKDSVAIYGSAQWSITDAYVASKLFKGALGTNNVESSDRLASAGAMAGLTSTFGLDGAVGCYEDIESADVFVLWDLNIAETDPVLFSHILARKKKDPSVRIIDLATRTTRTSYASDQSLLHTPRSTAAVASAICQEIVTRRWTNKDFVARHVAFKRGQTNIGYGLTSDALITDTATDASYDDYVSHLAKTTPEQAQQRSGLSAASIRYVASLYGDRSRKVMSIWGANVNQHARGTYLNNLLYNIHLLVGKIASPGNAALSLTGQPSGGNTVQEAGAMSQALPRGVVQNASDRSRAAQIWKVAANKIDATPSRAALSMFQAFERGDIRFLWIQATNPMVTLPNLERYRRAAAKADRFIVVSEVFPTPTTDVADVVLPTATWIEREGIIANVERRAQFNELMVASPGDAMSDGWQMIEVARRLGFGALFPSQRRGHVEQLWEEYRQFHDDPQSALAPAAELKANAGAMWPYVAGRATRWRYNAEYDPKADHSRGSFDFYGHADGRARIWLRAEDPPAEAPDNQYPFWFNTGPVLEHFGAGAVTQRIPTLHRSMPNAYVEIHADDAKRLGIKHGDRVRVVSRRGSLELESRIDYRSQPQRGCVFVPSFDESLPVSRLLLDAFCPLSGQPETNTCAVRIERLSARGGA